MEISELRGEMQALASELRGEMKDLRSELRGEMNDLRADFTALRAEFDNKFVQLEQRIIIKLGTIVSVAIAVAVAAGKLIS